MRLISPYFRLQSSVFMQLELLQFVHLESYVILGCNNAFKISYYF